MNLIENQTAPLGLESFRSARRQLLAAGTLRLTIDRKRPAADTGATQTNSPGWNEN